MMGLIIREAPGTATRPGRAHLFRYGECSLCGRWAAGSWPVVNKPTRPLCRTCVAAARREGYSVPDGPETTP
jgi:hypothetical protein